MSENDLLEPNKYPLEKPIYFARCTLCNWESSFNFPYEDDCERHCGNLDCKSDEIEVICE